MRVISGKYRGLMIEGYHIDGTRPTMDRVKESMFAMIQSYLKNSVVLDLFSGSGNLGIEAISNGCKEVYFVDYNKVAINMIEKNLKRLRVTEPYHIFDMDYGQALKEFMKKKVRFDVVLLDPPYQKHFIHEILKQLVVGDLLNDGAIVICEFDEEEIVSDTLTCIKEKKYGNKYVRVYQKGE